MLLLPASWMRGSSHKGLSWLVPGLARSEEASCILPQKASQDWWPRTEGTEGLYGTLTSWHYSPIRSSKLLNECLLISCMLSARAREKSARAHKCPHLSSHCCIKHERKPHLLWWTTAYLQQQHPVLTPHAHPSGETVMHLSPTNSCHQYVGAPVTRGSPRRVRCVWVTVLFPSTSTCPLRWHRNSCMCPLGHACMHVCVYACVCMLLRLHG